MSNFFEELERKPIKLNLGCGDEYILDGYENIDIREIDNERVIKMDVRNLPYEPNTIDEILAIDVYEHISHRESKDLLKYWVSLLKPGGMIYIQAPCLPFIIRHLLANPQLPVNTQTWELVINLIFGAQDYPENFHHTIVEPQLLHDYLREAGITGDIEMQERGANVCMRGVK
jgi:predicted SAM-dependent methyltransferase